ncbi:MAG: PfkB family carbohydrate kinase [Candidatus Zapsychrus exili]|nr:PfkB family carbohydrate kinase [Candidatus Zapsychrus exili]
MSLIALGTVALDDIKTPKGVKKDLLGGSASHFSMSASLFTKTHIAGIIGEDFPEKHMALFKKKKVDTTAIIKKKGKTFHWYGEYKKGDFNSAITIKTELGVITEYEPILSVSQKNIPNVFLANIDPITQMKFLKVMKNPKFVGLDTMNLWIDTMRGDVVKLMKKIDLFVLNDGEARMLAEETNLIKAAKILRKMGPSLIVIKKGENGVLFYCDKFMFSFPAFPVTEVVDPTGAGDTFAGGLMGYLIKQKKINEKTLRAALVYSTILSSFNVEGFVADKTASLNLTKVNKRRKEFIRFIAPN